MATKFDDRGTGDIKYYWTRRLAVEEARARRAQTASDRTAHLKACAHFRDLIEDLRGR